MGRSGFVLMLCLSSVAMALPTPQRGWIAEYEAHLRTEIRKHPNLTGIKSSRMSLLVGDWGKLSESGKVNALVGVIKCMAYAESNWRRLTVFREYDIPYKDSVTGMPIVSEGLLQLSYSDEKNHKGLCDFDWASDRARFLQDMKKKGQSFEGTDGRSILDPYKNISCGVQIMSTLEKKHKSSSATYAWGRYWAVMRPERAGYKTLQSCLKKQKPKDHPDLYD